MTTQPKFAAAQGFFVTGTDTAVGKTLVAGAIARSLLNAGKRVGVFKPIATGCQRRREGLVSTDAEFLAHCSNTESPLEQINPVRYHEPLAPFVAAQRSQHPIDWTAMELAYRNIVKQHDLVLVEGIGGVMAPICDDYLLLDLMADMALPIVLVARAGLGTINHTLLTLAACRQRDLTIAGIVLNGYRPDAPTLAEETNTQVLAGLAQTEILTVIPYDKNTYVDKGLLGADALAAAANVDWAALCRRLKT